MYLVQLAKQSKSPVPGPLQISDDPAVHRRWVEAGYNVGNRLVENHHVAVDEDTLAGAREAWKTLVLTGLCNLVVRTRRGAHFIFEGTSDTWPEDGRDVKGNGHIVWPPSIVRHDDGTRWRYEFVRGDAATCPLPFPFHLYPRPTKCDLATNIQIEANEDRLQIVSRAMRYAAAMSPSIAHSGGDNALYRFACHMVRNPPNGFGLTIEEAWPIALMFNQRCQPVWRESIVRRKLFEAKKRG